MPYRHGIFKISVFAGPAVNVPVLIEPAPEFYGLDFISDTEFMEFIVRDQDSPFVLEPQGLDLLCVFREPAIRIR